MFSFYFRCVCVSVLLLTIPKNSFSQSDCNNLPDFYFTEQVDAACTGDSIKFTVNDIGADRYYWYIPGYLGSLTFDEQFFNGVEIHGTWIYTVRIESLYGQYRYAINNKPNNRIIFNPTLKTAGLYRVLLSYFVQPNNKADVPITINSAAGLRQTILNQTLEPQKDGWREIGIYSFEAGSNGSVIISTDGLSNEYVIADGARFELVSFEDDTSITLYAQKGISESICVEAEFSACQNKKRICSDPVNIGSKMPLPKIIQQENSVCQGASFLYQVKKTNNAIYTWHLPDGMSINGQTGRVTTQDNEVWVHMQKTNISGTTIGISSSIPSCNMHSDTIYTDTIFFNGSDCPLADPEFVSQPEIICRNGLAVFSIKAIEGADEYEWQLPEGLQEVSTKKREIVKTNIPYIAVEPLTNSKELIDRIKVKALATHIKPSAIVATDSSIHVQEIPEYTISTTDPTTCNGKDGKINIHQLKSNTLYDFRFNYKNQVHINQNLFTDSLGKIEINELMAGNYDSIEISSKSCFKKYSESVVLKDPDSNEINNIFISIENDCSGKGKLNIILNKGSDNNAFEIDINHDGISDFKSKANDQLLIVDQLEVGTLFKEVSIKNDITKCISNSNFSGEIKPLILEQDKVQCTNEFQAKIKWNENGLNYIFSENDMKLIPAFDDSCLNERVQILFAIEPDEWKPVSEFKNFTVPYSDHSYLYWKMEDNLGNLASCKTQIKFILDHIAPSAFSPNRDGINDTWQIDFLSIYPNCVVTVYNRLGMKVFESRKGYLQNWDGKLNGRLVPVDTYYYIIILDGKSNIVKGNLSVIY